MYNEEKKLKNKITKIRMNDARQGLNLHSIVTGVSRNY